MFLNKYLSSCIIVISLFAHTHAFADIERVSTYLQGVSDKVIAIVSNNNYSKAEIRGELGTVINNNLDFALISNFLLARYSRTTDAETKQAFTKVLKQYVRALYAEQFQKYRGETLEITEVTGPKKRAYLVRTALNDPVDNIPINIDWRIIDRDGNYKIFDILINGVSMVLAQREEFQAIIKENNGAITPLTDILQQQINNIIAN